MKVKILAVLLFSAAFCLAQSNNQNKSDAGKAATADAPQSAAKMDCPCRKAMAEKKDAKSCCHQDSAAKDKEAMSCCQGKDGMSCMKDDKTNSADAAAGKCCKGDDQKGCCAKSDKATETAMACCGGSSGGHCGMQHHDHADMDK
jgi:hypothetical protein